MKLFSGSSSVSRAGVCLLLLLVCCGTAGAASPSGAPDGGVPLADIRVEVEDGYGSEAHWIDMVQSLAAAYIRRGEPVTDAGVQGLTAALKTCRRFQRIHLDTAVTNAGLVFVIDVTPFRLIKDIQIHGKYPLFEKQILNVMTLYAGDAFIAEEVEKQGALIAALYRQYGYVDPRVDVGSFQDEDGHYVLDVMIEKGRPYRLERLAFEGNKAFPDSKLRWRMKSVRSDHQVFSEKAFLEDIDKLKKYYLSRGFADAAFSHRLNRNEETAKVVVHIVMDEGDRYEASFVGNTAFGRRALKKDLDLFTSGNRSGLGVRKSIRNLEERYRRAGYAKAGIQVRKEVSQEDQASVRRLHFEIDEGPRTLVRRIMIRGNTVFSQAELQKEMLTRTPGWLHDGEYVPEVLEEDLLAIENLYQGSGYLNVAVDRTVDISADGGAADIAIELREGLQTRVARVEVEGVTAVATAEILASLKTQAGEPFSRSRFRNDEKRIAMLVSEAGYPYVRVSGHESLNEDASRVQLVFRVEQGRFIKRGRTFYAGNFRTNEKILERELEMKEGDPFSLKKLYQGQQNIRSMDIFRSVTFRPVGLKEEVDTIHLFTELEEEKPFYFEASGGYASEKGLFATSTVGDHNFWGLNKDFKIGGEISETGYRGESRIFEPRFWGSRISSDSGVFFERSEPFNQTFGTEKFGVDQVFSRKWRQKIKAGLGFHYERREQYLRVADGQDDTAYDPRSILAVTPSLSYDSRDNFMNPKQGLFCLAGIDLSKGIENSLDDFYKYRLDMRAYESPLDRLTLAARGSFGKIEPYGSRGTVPVDQLFYLGGTSSVRGFDENLLLFDENDDPAGGRLMAVANAEARIELGSNFEFSLFYDIGYLDDNPTPSKASQVRYATGIGLRYVTPVGAVGVVYGHKLNPEPEESSGRLHFSIGYTF